MAKNEQFDESVSKWLEESAPARIPERVLDATFERTRQSRQHVGWRALLGRLSMPKFLPALGSAAAIVVVAALALSLYANRQGGIGALPSPTPSPAPNSPSPSQSPSPAQAVDFPNMTTTFVSPRNGFSMKHPDRVALTPAEQLWGFGEQVDDGFDVVETGLAAVFKGASTNSGFGDGGSIDEQVDQYLSEDRGNLPGGCGVPRSEQAEITIDGQSGRISECATRVEGTVVVGGRLYLFILEHDRSDARAVFDAFVATIDLTPETAVDFPGLTKTFVSPTYGYSFGYMRGIIPATERWDPDDQPVEDIAHDPRFDAVETGLAAYLEGASTPIQDGISIDGWVDQYVTPLAAGGCGVPRSQQTEITIDGRPGRIAECANRLAGRSGANQVEATVVAGGRLYLFVLYRDSRDARAMFDAWVATIDLRPEDAAAPSSTPSS